MPRILLFLLLIFSTALSAASEEEGYPEAARLYAAGDWAGTEAVLERMQGSDWPAESLLLLGHAQARQEKTAEAMLSYRRVLDLRPGQPEATQNLSVLARRQGVLDPPPPPPILGFLHSIPGEAYSLAATIAAWLAIAGGTGLFFHGARAVAILSTIALATGVPALATVGAAWIIKERAIQTQPDSPPPVWLPDGQLMEESPLYSEPTRSADHVVESVPPGTPLRLLKKQGWSYVEIPSGNPARPLRGWIKNPPLWRPIRPGDIRGGDIL